MERVQAECDRWPTIGRARARGKELGEGNPSHKPGSLRRRSGWLKETFQGREHLWSLEGEIGGKTEGNAIFFLNIPEIDRGVRELDPGDGDLLRARGAGRELKGLDEGVPSFCPKGEFLWRWLDGEGPGVALS